MTQLSLSEDNSDNVEQYEIYYLTNNFNAVSILTTGILGPSESFGKYYADLLKTIDDRLFLFKNVIPQNFIEGVTGEKGTFPVVFRIESGIYNNLKTNYKYKLIF